MKPAHVVMAVLLAGSMPSHALSDNFTALVKTPSGQPLEDAAIILEPMAGKAPFVKKRVSIEQVDREFVPYLTIVQKGTAVDFPNRDKLKHHVFSFSSTKTFEIKLYSGVPGKPILFDQTGEVALGCNIHDWMVGHILVVDTPWFAKTNNTGDARIQDVPTGKYRLRLWHPRQKTASETRTINIPPPSTNRLELVMDVTPRLPHAKPAVDEENY